MPKPTKPERLDRHSGTGTRGEAKKEGHGGVPFLFLPPFFVAHRCSSSPLPSPLFPLSHSHFAPSHFVLLFFHSLFYVWEKSEKRLKKFLKKRWILKSLLLKRLLSLPK